MDGFARSHPLWYIVGMCGVLALLFLVVPAIEIFVILQVGSLIGLWPTLGVIAATAVAGAWLTRREGFTAVRKLQEAMLTGREVGGSLLGAALILVAGVLMLTPGFVTDVFGFLLLIPQTRAVMQRVLRQHVERRIARGDMFVFSPGGPRGQAGGERPRDRHADRRGGKPPVIDV